MARAKHSAEVRAQIEARLDALDAVSKRATLLFVGDIMLSRAVGRKIEEVGDYRYPFLKSADILSGADLTFGNLESAISDRGRNQGSIYSFRANPRVVEGLVYAGFDVLSLANNHIWDWGSFALLDTVSLLKAAGITPVGAGENYEEANEPAIVEANGIRIAALSYTDLLPESLEAGSTTPGISDFDLESVKANASALKAQGYLVIVMLHWGEEYEAVSNDLQKATAQELIDNGVDLVVGHHPHVVQELEQYRDGWIAYSLGNFIFDQTFSEETMRGAALLVEVDEAGVVEAKMVPVDISSELQPSFRDNLL